MWPPLVIFFHLRHTLSFLLKTQIIAFSFFDIYNNLFYLCKFSILVIILFKTYILDASLLLQKFQDLNILEKFSGATEAQTLN